MRKCRIGTAKFFTLLLLLYHTSANKQGVQGTYDEITMCSYAQVPLRKSEKLYAPCQLQINAQGRRTTLIQLQHDRDAQTVMAFLKTQNPAILFSEKLTERKVQLEDLPEKME